MATRGQDTMKLKIQTENLTKEMRPLPPPPTPTTQTKKTKIKKKKKNKKMLAPHDSAAFF